MYQPHFHQENRIRLAAINELLTAIHLSVGVGLFIFPSLMLALIVIIPKDSWAYSWVIATVMMLVGMPLLLLALRKRHRLLRDRKECLLFARIHESLAYPGILEFSHTWHECIFQKLVRMNGDLYATQYLLLNHPKMDCMMVVAFASGERRHKDQANLTIIGATLDEVFMHEGKDSYPGIWTDQWSNNPDCNHQIIPEIIKFSVSELSTMAIEFSRELACALVKGNDISQASRAALINAKPKVIDECDQVSEYDLLQWANSFLVEENEYHKFIGKVGIVDQLVCILPNLVKNKNLFLPFSVLGFIGQACIKYGNEQQLENFCICFLRSVSPSNYNAPILHRDNLWLLVGLDAYKGYPSLCDVAKEILIKFPERIDEIASNMHLMSESVLDEIAISHKHLFGMENTFKRLPYSKRVLIENELGV